MDNGWDLHALVRSCTTASAAAAATVNATTEEYHGSYNLERFTFGNKNNSFIYPAFGSWGNVSGGLEDVYTAGCGQLLSIVATTTSAAVDPDGEAFVHEKLPLLTDSQSFSTHGMGSQSTRPRKRKSQKKKVFQLTQQELGHDLWAWRKYGQKPIKGSPFRRCSTTKACDAKKQVERSRTNSTIFIVSYSGEHIHPLPTHRSSLAGSTRSNKFNTDNTGQTTSFRQHCCHALLLNTLHVPPRPWGLLEASPPLLSRKMNVKFPMKMELRCSIVMNKEGLKKFQDWNDGEAFTRSISSSTCGVDVFNGRRSH